MELPVQPFLVVGILLVCGAFLDALARRVRLPRVTLLILLGVVVGPAGLDILPPTSDEWFPVISTVALVMIGFLVGGELTRDRLGEHGRDVVVIAVVQALGTALVVAGGLLLLGFDAVLVLPLAGIAAATAPASTVAVVQESGRGGWLSRTVLGVVALDDVLTIVIFSLLLSVATVIEGTGGQAELIGSATWEIAGAVLVAVVLGVPMAMLTGRLRSGEPTREEALGVVLICAGVCLWLDVSFLFAAVLLGAVVTNLAQHHERPFNEIENIEWPFLVVFFVLAGAELQLDQIATAGLLGAAYIVLRAVGKTGGGAAAADLVDAPQEARRWVGVALLPQAGVALGLALLAADRFPAIADRLVAVVVATTVVFEVSGTVLTRVALQRGDR